MDSWDEVRWVAFTLILFFLLLLVTAFCLKNDNYSNYVCYDSESLILEDCLYAVVVSGVFREIYVCSKWKQRLYIVSVENDS